MDERETILAKIEQNQTDRQRLIDEAEKLTKELSNLEVTYSIGDRFRGENDSKYMLLEHNEFLLMANLKTGRSNSNAKVFLPREKREKLTKSDVEDVLYSHKICDFTRYWDNRKKERV